MRYLFLPLFVLVLYSCRQNQPAIEKLFIDSLISNYQPSRFATANQKDLEFWEGRVKSQPQSFVNLEKYASALSTRFYVYGNIYDLILAESIAADLSKQYKEPGYMLTLAGYKMLQHEFRQAKAIIDSVIEMKAEKYAAQMMLFDASFELGNIYEAAVILKNNYVRNDYAYNFRLSKLDHYQGKWDSAVAHMTKASDLSHSSIYLKTAALSNAADLYLHNGDAKKAAELYKQCLQLNSSHFHSMMGLGWIAAVYDEDLLLARKLFEFVRSKAKSPDVLFKLSQVVELIDRVLAKEYAMQFANEVSKPEYGNMYNKYLIQVYTGILDNPGKAVETAKKEVVLRPTSQTHAWLAWSLLCNGQKDKADTIYKTYVSGKALEATELYWMGKLMKATGKQYNSKQFFKAAKKNKLDLSPAMKKDLEENL